MKFNAVRPDFSVPLVCKADSGIHPINNKVYFRKLRFKPMESNPKEKAKELILFFDKIVYPYLGSGFMTNTEDEDVILKHAKEGAHKVVAEVLATCPQMENEIFGVSRGIEYWLDVQKEVTKYERVKP